VESVFPAYILAKIEQQDSIGFIASVCSQMSVLIRGPFRLQSSF
jgi:hypothetical protein